MAVNRPPSVHPGQAQSDVSRSARIERPDGPTYHHAMQFAAAATGLLCITLADGIISPAAFGQQQYILSDEDTWQAGASIDPATPQGELALARRTLARGDAERAEILATNWIERHDRHPLLPEAYLTRGDALRAQENYYQALFDYEYVARVFTATEAFVTALQRELEIATLYATGTQRKLWGMRILSAEDEAQELLIRIQERLPGSRLAEQAAMQLADFYFQRRKMELAVDMYSIFIENHPNSRLISKARRRLIYAHLATFKGPRFDAAGLLEARQRLQELITLEPATAERIGAHALLSRLDESDGRKLLLTAQWYRRTNDPVAAELTLRRLLRRYPRSVAATDALRLLDQILPKLPPGVLNDAPDYRALRGALLGPEAIETDERAEDPAAPASRSDAP